MNSSKVTPYSEVQPPFNNFNSMAELAKAVHCLDLPGCGAVGTSMGCSQTEPHPAVSNAIVVVLVYCFCFVFHFLMLKRANLLANLATGIRVDTSHGGWLLQPNKNLFPLFPDCWPSKTRGCGTCIMVKELCRVLKFFASKYTSFFKIPFPCFKIFYSLI